MTEKLVVTSKEMNRLTEQLIGKDKLNYYQKKFTALDKGQKLSFNLAGFLFSYLWAFYRGLYGCGLVTMLCFMGGFYLVLANSGDHLSLLVILGNLLTLLGNLVCGLFGNRLYKRSLKTIINEGIALPKSKQTDYFKEYADGNARICLGIVFATVFICAAMIIALAS